MTDNILSPIVSDGMIIQRNYPFPIIAKRRISVSFIGKKYEAQNKDGKYIVMLDPCDAGGPYEMDISCEDYSKKITGIYIGDVWLCAGQSNMEMQMARLRDDFGEEWKNAEFPLIHQFKPPQKWDFSSARDDISGGSWQIPSKETLSEFAALPWFFARFLNEKHKIPIGLIITPWGGTPVESWMSENALSDFPEKIAQGKQWADSSKREEAVKKSSVLFNEWEINLSHEDLGIADHWEKQETDISSWSEMTLPGGFHAASGNKDELDKFCGVIWLCKDFEVSDNFAAQNAKVWLGTIIDSDKVYINGNEIGNTGYRYPPRKYPSSGLLKKGKNRITVRVVCSCGDGGITTDKPFRVFTDNESVELTGVWKYKIGAKVKSRPEEYFFQRFPMGNYNAIIAPVLKYNYKGVIWYQGESNESSPDEYEKLFKSMIKDWRKNNREDLPFLFVQLPIFNPESDNNEKSRWAILREAQSSSLSLSNTAMAAALEFGEWNDIHPINKKDVAYRLFLAAEKTIFGEKNTSPGPMIREYNFNKKEKRIYIYFNNCGEGLYAKESLPCLTVTGSEGNFILPAVIEGKDCISIDISSVKNAQKILYAWADNPRCRNLYNSDSLPVIPFRLIIKGENDV